LDQFRRAPRITEDQARETFRALRESLERMVEKLERRLD